MDADRFDTLARSLRTLHTRRGLTRVLGGLALGPLALLGLAQTEAKRKKKKKKKRPTSSVIYVPVPAGDCPDGFRTCNGVCRDLLSDPNNCGRCGRSCGTHSDGTVPRPCCEGRCLREGDCCLDSECPSGDFCTDGACATLAGSCRADSLDSCPAVAADCSGELNDWSCTCLISTENELRCGRFVGAAPFCNDSLDCGEGTAGHFCSRPDCQGGRSFCYRSCHTFTQHAG